MSLPITGCIQDSPVFSATINGSGQHTLTACIVTISDVCQAFQGFRSFSLHPFKIENMFEARFSLIGWQSGLKHPFPVPFGILSDIYHNRTISYFSLIFTRKEQTRILSCSFSYSTRSGTAPSSVYSVDGTGFNTPKCICRTKTLLRPGIQRKRSIGSI